MIRGMGQISILGTKMMIGVIAVVIADHRVDPSALLLAGAGAEVAAGADLAPLREADGEGLPGIEGGTILIGRLGKIFEEGALLVNQQLLNLIV